MNPKRVYGPYTLVGIIVVRVDDPNFLGSFPPQRKAHVCMVFLLAWFTSSSCHDS